MNDPLPDRPLEAYARNRPSFSALELMKYAGLWIAWKPDATQVLVSARDRKSLRSLVEKAGEDPQSCVVERVPARAR
jgi:hypothetical protein